MVLPLNDKLAFYFVVSAHLNKFCTTHKRRNIHLPANSIEAAAVLAAAILPFEKISVHTVTILHA